MRGLKLCLEIVEFATDGRVKAVRRIRVNSWLANAAAMFHSAFGAIASFGAGATATDITGVARTMQWRNGIGFSPHHFEMNGAVGQARGIVVGTGATPVQPTDFKIETIVSHGNGPGQLFHQAQGVNAALFSIPGGYQVQMFRQFDNNTLAAITINEVGIYAFHNFQEDAQGTFMVLRDLVPGGHVVTPGNSVVIRYFFNWTV